MGANLISDKLRNQQHIDISGTTPNRPETCVVPIPVFTYIFVFEFNSYIPLT